VNATPAVLDPPVIGRLEPLRPLPVHEVTRAMSEYQQGLEALLADSDRQSFVNERTGRESTFVKRSGWRKIATWFGLDLLIGSMEVDRDEYGNPLRARVIGRVIAPNGRKGEDVGACSITERGFSKPEHDLLATAATRALNRATSNLVGMGELSAEEMADEIATTAPLPEWAEPAANGDEFRDWLTNLVGEARAEAITVTLTNRYGYVPVVLSRFAEGMHAMLGPELAARRADTTTTE